MTPERPDRVDDLTDEQIKAALLTDSTAVVHQEYAVALCDIYRTVRASLLKATELQSPLDGLAEHTTPIDQFAYSVGFPEAGGDGIMDGQVAHLATIGGDWFAFYGRDLKGYVIAYQGHAGGDSLGPSRKRPLTWWSTDPGLSKLAAWTTAVEFITAQVHADLKDGWGE
jgi:hypothetical protein